MNSLTYESLELLRVSKPVHRIPFIIKQAKGRDVLDLGSFDETAFDLKKMGGNWLFAGLDSVAHSLIGVDSRVPSEEYLFKRSKIMRRDVNRLKSDEFPHVELIIAGEILEHIENPMFFLKMLKKEFPGKELLLSTPNGLNFSNTLLGLISREVQHSDHLFVSTYKTLNTLMMRAGFQSWELIPYYFTATEMKMKSRNPLFRLMVELIERSIRVFEWFFPSLSMGYLVKIKI